MDELIYKQDAIEALLERAYKVDTTTENGEYFWEGLVISKDIIEHIPSAQQWISCEKELPDVEQPVRISVHGRVFDAVYKGLSSDQEPMWLSHGCVYWAEEVSRWMPLPEPYKEVDDEDL